MPSAPSISLRWIASTGASSLHAAQALIAGQPLADPDLAQRLAASSRQLASTIEGCNLSPERLLRHLVPLSAGISQPRQLAEVALAKLISRDQAQSHVPRLAEALRALAADWQQALPGTVDELELRSAPLRSQWEARGPGLMAEVARLTDPQLVVSQADVVLVHPVLGGAGCAYLPYNTVVIEAVLADPHPGLAETARLGWLLAQLQCELPKFQGRLMADELARTAALAMVPAVLTAAEEVELARCDEAAVKLAIGAWYQDGYSHRAAAALDWWTTYLSARPPWEVALGALARMLRDETAPA